MHLSCKAKEGQSPGGERLFAVCHRHSQCCESVRLEGAEMKSEAVGEVVKRVV